ncbi:MAG: AzlD domain-containing protein [Clostridiales bacterium]|nr:AzlD domain-containing protein [Clostridiales bacterium]
MLFNALILALASYIPRFVPLVIFRKRIKSKFICSLLFYIPYAVLAGLTFPSILYSTGNIYTAIIGTAVALGLSFFKVNMALVALICVLTVFGLGFLF